MSVNCKPGDRATSKKKICTNILSFAVMFTESNYCNFNTNFDNWKNNLILVCKHLLICILKFAGTYINLGLWTQVCVHSPTIRSLGVSEYARHMPWCDVRYCNIYRHFLETNVILRSTIRLYMYIMLWCTIQLPDSEHYATSWKVAGSSPDEVDFFILPNTSSRTMVLGSTQPLTEMSTRKLPGR
jgi:hypothetical protein